MKNLLTLLALTVLVAVSGTAMAAACPSAVTGSNDTATARLTAFDFDYYVAENAGVHINLSAWSPEIEYGNVRDGWHTRYKADAWGSPGAIATWTLDTVPSSGTLYEGQTALSEGDTVTDPNDLYYAPAADTTGTFTFGYCVTDTQSPTAGISEVATVTLHVEARDSITMPYGYPTPPFGITDTPPADPAEWPSAEAAGYYYIDGDHGSCSDANTYGYPDVPRCTMAYGSTVNAGRKMVLASDVTLRSSSWDRIWLEGDSNNRAWVVGDELGPDRPRVLLHPSYSSAGQELRVESNNGYWAITGIEFDGPGLDSKGNTQQSFVRFSTFRNQVATSGNTLDFNCDTESTSYTCNNPATEGPNVLWHVAGFDNGQIDQVGWSEVDVHFINGVTQNGFWILDSIAAGNAGDGIQMGNRNDTSDVWIGRFKSSTNMENCVDVKDFDNLLVVESDCWDIRTVTYSSSGGNGQAFYINDEDAQTNFAYFVNNRAWDTNGSGFASQNIDDSRFYAIGNRAFQMPEATCFDSGQGEAERHFLFNTCYNAFQGINTYTSGSSVERYYVGNVIQNVEIAGRATGADPRIDQWDYNAYINVSTGYIIGTNQDPTTVDLAGWQADTGFDANTQIDIDPGWVDASKFDFRLTAGSELIDVLPVATAATVAPGIVDLQNDLGVTWLDFTGTERGASAYDGGADELGGESSTANPNAPVLNSVVEVALNEVPGPVYAYGNFAYILKTAIDYLIPDAHAVINPTGRTWTGGDLETCGDGSLSTNCSTARVEVTGNCTAPTTKTDGSALPIEEISHYLMQAKDDTNDNQITKIVSACGNYTAYLKSGDWDVRMKTVDTQSRQSAWSNTVNLVITP